MNQITKEQERYVIEHINDRPRTKVAKDAGICLSSLYRIVREHGGFLDYSRSRRNPEWERIIRENYATMTGHEIERKFGISLNRANKMAQDLGIEHSDETKARIKAEARERLSDAKKRLDYKALARKWKAKRRIDEMRVWEGKRPLTNYKLRAMPNKSYKAKWHLVNRYGYFEIDCEPMTLGYDEETKRRINLSREHARFNEDYYSQRYGFQFVAV